MSIAEKLATIAENEQRVYDAGKKSEYDAFWDNFQANGTRKYYGFAFAYSWNDVNYKPKYPFIGIKTANNMFYNSTITDTLVDIDVSGIGASEMFGWNSKIHTIRKLKISETTTGLKDTFIGCTTLANITIEGVIGTSINLQYSPLTKASIKSVINALSSTTSGQTCTLKQSAKEAAFTADEWAELIAPKTHWTFSFV